MISAPTSLDLFAGAGGITEGFRQAGFRCLFANDFNANAVETFSLNHPEAEVVCGSIEDLDPGAIRKRSGLKRGELDVIVGGPPCQGFSINAPERFLEDPRNSMFKHYLRFVDEFAPAMFMFENVPGMLSLGGGKMFNTVVEQFEARGYATSARILLAAHYGVPQIRWRMIILGSRIGRAPEHPEPTHFFNATLIGARFSIPIRPAPTRSGRRRASRASPTATASSARGSPNTSKSATPSPC